MHTPEKRPTNLAPSPLLVSSRRQKTDRGQASAFRALPGFPRQCPLPHACHHLPKGTTLELGRGAHLGNTIPNQPYRRRVSTDRLDREDSQLAASLAEPGPTLAGNPPTLISQNQVSDGEGTTGVPTWRSMYSVTVGFSAILSCRP